MPFGLNRAQQIFHEKVERLKAKYGKVRVVLLKARQWGGSTYIASRIFKKTTTAFNQHSKVVAHSAEMAMKLLQMYTRFYDMLPLELQPMKKYRSKQELSFENPTQNNEERKKMPGLLSSIGVYSAETKGAGRGSTLRQLHLSEVSSWENPEKTALALLNTVPSTGGDSEDTEIYIESTAMGVGDYFYKKYYSAKRQDFGEEFHAIFIPWYVHEAYTIQAPVSFERDLNEDERKLLEEEHTEWEYVNPETGRKTLSLNQLYWRRITIATQCDHDEKMFRQEYPLTDEEAFIASGLAFFDAEDLQRRIEVVQREVQPVFVGDLEWKKVKTGDNRRKQEPVLLKNPHGGMLSIWAQPEKGEAYVYFADVGEGVRGSDFSVIHIFRRRDGYQCARWRGRLEPDKLADVVFDLGHYYNWAFGTPETNNHGLTTILRLKELRYPTTYKRQVYDKSFVEPKEQEGWVTSARTRPLMLDSLRKMFRDGDIILNCLVTLEEMKTFVKVNNKYQAQEGCYDDCVMSAAGACQMLVELPAPAKSKVKSWTGTKAPHQPHEPRVRPKFKYDRYTGNPM